MRRSPHRSAPHARNSRFTLLPVGRVRTAAGSVLIGGLLGAVIVGTISIGTATAATAGTAPPATAGSTALPAGEEQVQLVLAPRDEAGLRALAADASHLTAAVRTTRRAQVLPDAARVRTVVSRAEQLGFAVTAANTSSVSLRGSATLVRRLFGSARASDPTSPTAQALPELPGSLQGLVTVAGGGDETRPAELPRDIAAAPAPSSGTSPQPAAADGSLSQADFRALYGVPDTGTAVPTAASPAIATIEFSNWDSSDLTAYAAQNNLYGGTAYDPVAGGGYTAVDVNGGAVGSANQLEVALDQEALATLAPSLRQVAYFTSDSTGFAATMNQIAADAATRKIVAVSDSWGRCELDRYNGNSSLLTADENAVLSAASAGLTIFAASGDLGSKDCASSQSPPVFDPNANLLAVDSPASLPYVTAVGGTSIDGTNTENSADFSGADLTTASTTTTSWDDGYGTGGGGYSAFVCASAAQAAVLPLTSQSSNARCATKKARGLPDIALSADPNVGGLDVVSPSGCASLSASPTSAALPCAVAGTSLATPLAAAGFATAIVQNGALSGIGDITPALYAAAGTTGFLDVTAHQNNSLDDNSPFTAARGWDPLTGLGAPNWGALAGRLMGTTVANSLFGIQTSGTVSGRVEIDELSQSSGYKQFHLRVATALPDTSPADWQYFIAPFRGDGKHDLYAIRTADTGSGQVEVHVLSEASGYQSFLLHAATAMAAVPANQWQFAVSSFAGDHASDIYAIGYAGTASNHVEVHVLSAATNYTTWLTHAATALASVTPGSWQFLVGDAAGSGDLVGVLRSGASGHTEVHTLTRASGYRVFSLHKVTPLGPTLATSGEFSLALYDGDAIPDLAVALLAGTGSGTTELHILGGASAYTKFLLHAATAIPPIDPASAVFQLAR